jgi:hypothetical protein
VGRQLYIHEGTVILGILPKAFIMILSGYRYVHLIFRDSYSKLHLRIQDGREHKNLLPFDIERISYQISYITADRIQVGRHHSGRQTSFG